MNDDFEQWISKKDSKKRKSGTYRERILKGEQSAWTTKKRKPMRSSSKKRSKEMSQYSKVSATYLKENPECEVCGNPSNPSIHHKKGRLGSLLTDERYFMHACLAGSFLDEMYPESNHNHTGGCHGWIEANRIQARKLGWILY